MAKPQWTTGQQHCINARGGTVLVSAAAGSGKTAVLIERIVSLLCDPISPVEVDKLLIVTFTKAAAAEMRSRLNRRLAEELAEDPHNRHLLRQQMLLPQAMICTIDSFCIQLLREYATQAGVSARFTVADQTALRLMKHDAARETINHAHEQATPAFLALCNTLTNDRSDDALIEELLRAFDFIQAHPFPLQWLEQQQARYRDTRDLADTIWGQILLRQAKESLEAAAIILETALNDMAHDTVIYEAYGPSLVQAHASTLEALTHFNGSWDDVANAVRDIAFSSFGGLRNYDNDALKQYITDLRDRAKKLIGVAAVDCLGCSSEQAAAELAQSAPLIDAFFDLIRDFSDRFAAAKSEQNMLDFNDAEHRLLAVLATPNEDGSFTRTEIAKEIGARFSHIMVDEYQDTNATQDTLFAALSDDEQNLFFVGDLKQSIYGFRQAMPSIFQGRRKNSTPYNGHDFPASITLGNNFRSRSQVADTTNFVFRRLMTEDIGGIEYNADEELVASASFPLDGDPSYDTEIIVTDRQAHPENLSRHQAEARLIGERIHEMIESGFQVTDRSESRRMEYRDCCILMRSVKDKASEYIKELQAMGIPAVTDARDNLFDSAEIRLIMAILKTIDNPLLDVPMLATLMSPIYGFTPDEVAQIRSAANDVPLFSAIRKTSRGKSTVAEHCRRFLQSLGDYRVLAAAMPADRLIRRLYEDSNLLSIMSAKSGGAVRIANLRAFYDLARRFEDHDFRGLSAFIRHMAKLEEKGIAVPTNGGGDAQNAVKLMTIHHSKGLEFPVVFLADLGAEFSHMSLRNDILLHAEHGVSIIERDRDNMTQSTPFHRRALSFAIKRSELAEELRVLYVAMTRAKDKLILLTSVKNLNKKMSDLQIAACSTTEQFTPSFVFNAAGIGDWVLACVSRHPAGVALRAIADGNEPTDTHIDGLSVLFRQPPLHAAAPAIEHHRDEALSLENARDRLDYTYPYTLLGQIPAKVTASQTAHNNAFSVESLVLSRPAFMSKSGLTPAQRGTATHLFLEHMQFGTISAAEQAAVMVERDVLTEQQQAALNLPALQRFLQSDLAARMAASPLLLREFPFTIEKSAAELRPDIARALPSDASDEHIIIQGIADAVFEENGELVIVDYKTDRVDDASILAERYRSQLMIYQDALSRALQRPVKECVLYSFHLNETVTI